MKERFEVARAAALAAQDIIMSFYRKNPDVSIKGDLSPVTEADIQSEQKIRSIIQQAFPDDGFYGEETGQQALDSDYLWLVDPIDGTKSFVREYPFFSTQIALMHKGELVMGISNAPAYGEMAWAIRGQGAWLNSEAICCSGITDMAKASLSLGNIHTLAARPAWKRLGQIVPAFHRVRGYGDFLHYHLLARGAVDAIIESDVNILDIAALVVILTEAGAVFTDLSGQPPGLDTTTVLAAVPALHRPLLEQLAYDA